MTFYLFRKIIHCQYTLKIIAVFRVMVFFLNLKYMHLNVVHTLKIFTVPLGAK